MFVGTVLIKKILYLNDDVTLQGSFYVQIDYRQSEISFGFIISHKPRIYDWVIHIKTNANIDVWLFCMFERVRNVDAYKPILGMGFNSLYIFYVM